MVEEYSNDEICLLQIHLGGDRNFSYLLGDNSMNDPVHPDGLKPAAVVDPGFAPDDLYSLTQERGFHIAYILITHGHPDHVGGAARLAELSGAPVLAGAQENVAGAQPLTDSQELVLGNQTIQAVATAGHSPGHFCFLCSGNLMTGDLLFCGKVGGTGPFFEGSSARQEYESLARVLEIPDETRIFPGHDYYGGQGDMKYSTVAFERDNNPFLTVSGFEAFCDLKENWATYKKEHGIR